MNDSKMLVMPVGMEHQRKTENTQIWIYLSAVRKEAKEDSLPEKIMLAVVELFFSYTVYHIVLQIGSKIAYAERGYEACGGEYLLAILAFVAAWKVINIFFKYFRRESNGEKRYRRNASNRYIGRTICGSIGTSKTQAKTYF